MIEFFDKLIEIILTPGTYLAEASDSLNSFTLQDNIFKDYLGYMRYMMGSPLYLLFSTSALVGIAVSLFGIVTKLVERFRNIC